MCNLDILANEDLDFVIVKAKEAGLSLVSQNSLLYKTSPKIKTYHSKIW